MSFQQGVSGLTAAGRNLEVIGNNVANASTVGAKKSRAEFADVYARASGGGGANTIGIGVSLAAVSQQFTQGSISATDNPLDVAINGGGFFQLKDLNGSLQYTRNGQFKVDNEGNIINAQGSRLLGYQANEKGELIGGVAQPLKLPTQGIKPAETHNMLLEANFDARAAATDSGAGLTGATPTIDISNANTYTKATSVNVYDSKGQEVAITYYVQKSSLADTWNIYGTANGQPISPDASTPPAPGVIAQAVFNSDGTLKQLQDMTGSPLATSPKVPVSIPATTSSTGNSTVPIPADAALTGVPLDLSGLTQYGAVFGVTNVTQDGYPPGQLSSVTMQPNGIVLATYSSGRSSAIGQIELATFRNMQGLQPLGGNVWGSTYASGDAIPGTPGSGNLGVLQSGSVEESNVDLTSELVNMMVAQRIYQANAQTVKTQDSVLQTLVNLR